MRTLIAAAVARLIRKPGVEMGVRPRTITPAFTTAAAAGCLLCVTAVGHAEQATTQVSAEVSRPMTFDIPAQPISTALKAFAEQTALQLIFTESDVGASRTSGIKGELSPTVALAEILRGTDLEYRITASNVVVVRKAGMERRLRIRMERKVVCNWLKRRRPTRIPTAPWRGTRSMESRKSSSRRPGAPSGFKMLQ